MLFVKILFIACLVSAHPLFAQEFDKKAFCATLKNAMTAIETSSDSLKGEFIGANSFGDQQWNPRIMLSGATSGTYNYTTYLAQEYRATYVMKEKGSKEHSAALYKLIVSTTRACYGTDFLLQEKITTEHRGKVKVDQLEAEFTRTEFGNDTGHQHPYIRITSTAYETGETFEVLVELIKNQ